MRKETITCDRCGNEVATQWHTIEDIDHPGVSFDLCDACFTALLAWISTCRAKKEFIKHEQERIRVQKAMKQAQEDQDTQRWKQWAEDWRQGRTSMESC